MTAIHTFTRNQLTKRTDKPPLPNLSKSSFPLTGQRLGIRELDRPSQLAHFRLDQDSDQFLPFDAHPKKRTKQNGAISFLDSQRSIHSQAVRVQSACHPSRRQGKEFPLKRKRYQAGSLHRKQRKRDSDVWVLRYRESQQDGTQAHRSIIIGTVDEYPTKAKAQKAAEALRLTLNTDYKPTRVATVATLVDRYMLEAMPERYSTTQSYTSYLNGYIKPKWGDYDVITLGQNPFWVEKWLRALPNAPKTKAHIKGLMHRLYEYAMKWRMMSIQRNPMELVEVKGASRRMRKPKVLTVEQYHLLLPAIPEPYRTMVVIAQCLGLRISEILGLQWRDVDFQSRVIRVERGVVQGHVDRVKSEYSEDDVPLDPAIARVLQHWQQACPSSAEGWLFSNPATRKPYHASEICKNYIRPAAEKLGFGKIGWHTFRHTYRTLLDETGAPMKVQQELMRHANIQTTMNVYGSAMLESKRTANSKIVRMVLVPSLSGENEKGRSTAAS